MSCEVGRGRLLCERVHECLTNGSISSTTRYFVQRFNFRKFNKSHTKDWSHSNSTLYNILLLDLFGVYTPFWVKVYRVPSLHFSFPFKLSENLTDYIFVI